MSGICLHFDTGGKGCVHKAENNECKSEIEIGDELRSMCILYTANNCSFFKCDDQKWNMPAPNGNVVTLNFPSVKSSLETWKKWKSNFRNTNLPFACLINPPLPFKSMMQFTYSGPKIWPTGCCFRRLFMLKWNSWSHSPISTLPPQALPKSFSLMQITLQGYWMESLKLKKCKVAQKYGNMSVWVSAVCLVWSEVFVGLKTVEPSSVHTPSQTAQLCLHTSTDGQLD